MKNLHLSLLVTAFLFSVFQPLVVLSQNSILNHSKIKIEAVKLDKGLADPIIEVAEFSFEGKIKWGHTLTVYSDIEFQEIEGFGGAFNEIGGEALSHLTRKQEEAVLENLFSEQKAGFTYCRTAIGASDFGINAYSYSEVADDYEMQHFSIERDLKYVLPYLTGALKVNTQLKIFASPWSPPAWMKISGLYTDGTKESSRLKPDNKVYKAYARYFAKYIKAYAKSGVKIQRICIQNEADAVTYYPSCIVTPQQMLEFGAEYLKPELLKQNIQTEVFAGTFRAVDQLDLHNFIKLENASKLDGIGIQYTDGNLIQEVQIKYPGFKIFHTEGDCYNGKNTEEQAFNRLPEVASYINSGATNFTYWNMILNESSESGWGWSQNSLIKIHRNEKKVEYTPDYNAMYLMGRYIKPGDLRVAAVSKFDHVVLKNKQGDLKIIIQNNQSIDRGLALCVDGKTTSIKLPANSLIAITVQE